MIVDSSALLAVLLNESDAQLYARAIARAPRIAMPTPTWVEVAMVTDARMDAILRERFESEVRRMKLEIVPFLPEHAIAAREAWTRFGRGRHPARLNYGDCMAYGFARVENQPLLFKGGDFSLTDIEPALKD